MSCRSFLARLTRSTLGPPSLAVGTGGAVVCALLVLGAACGAPHADPPPAARTDGSAGTAGSSRATPSVSLGLQTMAASASLHADPVWSLGRAAAPVQIVYYTDFECPFCRTQALTEDPAIFAAVRRHSAWALQVVDLAVSGHRHALEASLAIRCAMDSTGTGFPTLAAAVFSHQSRWHGDTVSVAAIVAARVPDDQRQAQCRVVRRRALTAALVGNLASAKQHGATGTPSFAVRVGARDTILRGQTSADEIQRAITHLTVSPAPRP